MLILSQNKTEISKPVATTHQTFSKQIDIRVIYSISWFCFDLLNSLARL